MKKISILTPCYNEEMNVELLYNRVTDEMSKLLDYDYELIFIDNDSNDNTVNILKRLAISDKRLKIIINIKNYGHIKSPFYGLLQCDGDAVITMASDLQDPPELIHKFIQKWEEGYKIVVGTKPKSHENIIMFTIRRFFYNLIKNISEISQIKNFTGFGLYDKSFIEILKKIEEPYPYFRGLVSELGYKITEIEFIQPNRNAGKTSNNFYTLYDMAMLGFVSYSKIPLRMSSFIGFFVSFLSFIVAIIYIFYKLLNWSAFQLGLAPLIIGIFFWVAYSYFFWE